MFVEIIGLKISLTLHVDQHQLTVKQPSQTHCVALVDKLDWECSDFETWIEVVVILCLVFFHSLHFFLLFDCTLERNLTTGSSARQMQLVKQNLPISSDEYNLVVFDPFHVNDGFTGLINGIELNLLLEQVSIP